MTTMKLISISNADWRQLELSIEIKTYEAALTFNGVCLPYSTNLPPFSAEFSARLPQSGASGSMTVLGQSLVFNLKWDVFRTTYAHEVTWWNSR